ncbi:response regulator [Colwellia sp. 1_MG-2023]|uniref:response regulator n=1 Tax=Colwellia sp. 1_MG-2023 TaxID=3062649 RepID=UPI0026E24028|nr:response regulator [Colwellia sp. 1_MG-2023]MDO6446743.1 response regulator [Colwellia sp. 1_MG-2023]
MVESLETSILIVDDSTINTRIIAKMISDLNHQVLIAQSGLEALKLLTTFKPSLILLDIKMPNMDGFECCKRIKKSNSRADIPIIFISSSDCPHDRAKAKQLGGACYLTKPVNANQLLEEIEFHLPWA